MHCLNGVNWKCIFPKDTRALYQDNLSATDSPATLLTELLHFLLNELFVKVRIIVTLYNKGVFFHHSGAKRPPERSRIPRERRNIASTHVGSQA